MVLMMHHLPVLLAARPALRLAPPAVQMLEGYGRNSFSYSSESQLDLDSRMEMDYRRDYVEDEMYGPDVEDDMYGFEDDMYGEEMYNGPMRPMRRGRRFPGRTPINYGYGYRARGYQPGYGPRRQGYGMSMYDEGMYGPELDGDMMYDDDMQDEDMHYGPMDSRGRRLPRPRSPVGGYGRARGLLPEYGNGGGFDGYSVGMNSFQDGGSPPYYGRSERYPRMGGMRGGYGNRMGRGYGNRMGGMRGGYGNRMGGMGGGYGNRMSGMGRGYGNRMGSGYGNRMGGMSGGYGNRMGGMSGGYGNRMGGGYGNRMGGMSGGYGNRMGGGYGNRMGGGYGNRVGRGSSQYSNGGMGMGGTGTQYYGGSGYNNGQGYGGDESYMSGGGGGGGSARDNAPEIDSDRRNRSPGLTRNFYDQSTSDFKKPYYGRG